MYPQKKCTYEQKNALVALTLEFIFGIPFGAGFFYLELGGQGLCRFFVFLSFLLSLVAVRKCSNCPKTIQYVYVIIVSFIIFMIWINDMVAIAKGTLDGNGFSVRAIYYNNMENIINQKK